jgi:hypothetical protein
VEQRLQQAKQWIAEADASIGQTRIAALSTGNVNLF